MPRRRRAGSARPRPPTPPGSGPHCIATRGAASTNAPESVTTPARMRVARSTRSRSGASASQGTRGRSAGRPGGVVAGQAEQEVRLRRVRPARWAYEVTDEPYLVALDECAEQLCGKVAVAIVTWWKYSTTCGAPALRRFASSLARRAAIRSGPLPGQAFWTWPTATAATGSPSRRHAGSWAWLPSSQPMPILGMRDMDGSASHRQFELGAIARKDRVVRQIVPIYALHQVVSRRWHEVIHGEHPHTRSFRDRAKFNGMRW